MADPVTLRIDSSDLARGLSDLERKQLPIATVWALNDTAYAILAHTQSRMDRVFDRPTRFAKTAFMVWRAKKSTMTAEVKERPSAGSRHFLKVQEGGGTRPRTGLEGFLQGKLRGGQAAVPASGAKLNAFGNWSPAERKRATNDVTGGPVSGNGRTRYFVPGRGSRLSLGVWKRHGPKRKPKLTKVLHFTTAMPKFRERLGFYDGAEMTFDVQFPIEFTKAFERAIATAR